MPRTQRLARRIDHGIAYEHPEVIVMRLLQDALGATRRALDMAHPRPGNSMHDIHNPDHAGRLAPVLVAHLIEVDNLLDAYHQALRHQALLQQLSQIDLPF